MTISTFEITQEQAETLEADATAQGGYGTNSTDSPDTMRAGWYWQEGQNWHGVFETKRTKSVV